LPHTFQFNRNNIERTVKLYAPLKSLRKRGTIKENLDSRFHGKPWIPAPGLKPAGTSLGGMTNFMEFRLFTIPSIFQYSNFPVFFSALSTVNRYFFYFEDPRKYSKLRKGSFVARAGHPPGEEGGPGKHG
jgi:hypothetical protein